MAVRTAGVLSAIILISAARGALADDLVLTLERAQQMAAEHSFSVKAADERYLSADRQYRAAQAGRFPTLHLDAYSRYINELQTVDLPIGEIEIGTKRAYQADLKLAVPLFTGGKLSNTIKARGAARSMTAAELSSEQRAVEYDTRTSYLNLLLTRSLVSAARSSLARLRIIKEDVTNLALSGMADSVDLLEADQAVAAAQRHLVERRLAEETTQSKLIRLLGVDLTSTITPADTLLRPFDESTLPDMPSAKNLQRPELLALRSTAAMSQYAAEAEKSGYFPDLSAFAGYSAGKPNRDVFGDTWNDYFSAGMQLTWRFNLAGETGHRTGAARRQYAAAQMEYKNLEESLLLQARIALQAWQRSLESFSLAKEELRIAGRKFDLAGSQHEAGTLSLNRLLEIESELNTAEDAYRASLLRAYLAETDYLYAIGSDRLSGGLQQ